MDPEEARQSWIREQRRRDVKELKELLRAAGEKKVAEYLKRVESDITIEEIKEA